MACFLLNAPGMFLKEAMLRCAQLQQETAARYDALCDEAGAGEARIGAWRGAALRERRRAGFLDALAGLCSALEDEGPFLVDIPLQIENVRRALDKVLWRRERCPGHPACTCDELLRAVPCALLYANLVELAEPEVRRALRLIGNEIRIVRRDAEASAPRKEATLVVAPTP